MSAANPGATSPQTVHVPLGDRSYDISIGNGNLAEVGRWVTSLRKVTHVVLISDGNVAKYYQQPVEDAIAAEGIRVTSLGVPAGEQSKSVPTAQSLWEAALADRVDRKSTVVALGGGVVGDLAGFVAATMTRGLDFFQIPTSLLAQVDSSVGGKVGINLPSAKNIVGAFWQPKGVLIDTAVLKTLPRREYLSGLAEVIKYGVILDADFFAYLEANVQPMLNRDPAVLQKIIARSCELKAQVVAEDETETTGLRAILNYGHTFCHALETVSGYGEYLHGEAVSVGMLCASRLGEKLGVFDAESTQRQAKLLSALELPVATPKLSETAILSAMQRDKKVEHGKLRFIVPHAIGKVVLTPDVPSEMALAAWREGIEDESA
ncbi:3-dehydroquinate synthase [Bremerella cremea]|uniref:3-dehydroquinate synthase n=1 Tax=Bremerella cremea TaxID=1031537 RepID=A0A368KU73_9BACT|nr:3-dehydroquinate synthase [Bremerella cremea]RCS53929.1 3-dehydroquinate synthase [Bremerella cremea]